MRLSTNSLTLVGEKKGCIFTTYSSPLKSTGISTISSNRLLYSFNIEILSCFSCFFLAIIIILLLSLTEIHILRIDMQVILYINLKTKKNMSREIYPPTHIVLIYLLTIYFNDTT